MSEKKRRGAPRNNLNAQKRLVWLEQYDLSTGDGITEVLKELIRQTWQGKIGTRQASALTTALKQLMEQVAIEPALKKLEELQQTQKREVK